MLPPDEWQAVLSRLVGTVYRGTERISSNALLNLLEVGPDPVIRQKMAKRQRRKRLQTRGSFPSPVLHQRRGTTA